MNNEIEDIPLSVRLLTLCLDHLPIRGIFKSCLTSREILGARLVNSQWSYYFDLPQYKVQPAPPAPSSPTSSKQQDQNQNQNQRGGILIEEFNGNIYGSGSDSGRGDFIDRIPHRKCRISILVNTPGFFPRLSQFLANNERVNQFITHLNLSRCYSYEPNPNLNPNRNWNRNRNSNQNQNQNWNRNFAPNQILRSPLLTVHEFFMLIFAHLQNLEYLSIDRIPLDWAEAGQSELMKLANWRGTLPNSRSSLRTLKFSHGWLNMRDESFLQTFLGLFPHLEEIWGMSLKCSDSVRFSGKSRVMKSIILEGSTRTGLFVDAVQSFTDWVTEPHFGVELEEIKFNLNFLSTDQYETRDKSNMSLNFSAILNYHRESLKTLQIQPLLFWFPSLFHRFPVFPQVTFLKFNGKPVFTETRNANGTVQVNEESYKFFPSDVDFQLTRHFPNLTHVKISMYFPNHSRTSGTILNYCFPLSGPGISLNLTHVGVNKLELVDLACLMNFGVIQRFSLLFPNVSSLTLRKNARDRHFASGLSAIWQFWPRLQELQCKLVYKTGNRANMGNWDSAISGFSEEQCRELRRNGGQGCRDEMEVARFNSPSILNMTELKRFILIFTTDSASTAQVDTAVSGTGPGFMSLVSWKHGFSLMPNLELIIIFGKFCRGFRRMLGPIDTSSRTKVIDETLS